MRPQNTRRPGQPVDGQPASARLDPDSFDDLSPEAIEKLVEETARVGLDAMLRRYAMRARAASIRVKMLSYSAAG